MTKNQTIKRATDLLTLITQEYTESGNVSSTSMNLALVFLSELKNTHYSTIEINANAEVLMLLVEDSVAKDITISEAVEEMLVRQIAKEESRHWSE